MEVAIKVAGAALDPLQLTFLRFFIGGLLVLPFGLSELKKLKGVMDAKMWLFQILLGIICVPVSMLLFQYGVLESNAATSAVIFCVNPIFTAIFAHFFNHGDRFSSYKAIAILLVVPGIIMMLRPWDIQDGNTVIGALLSVGAAATFSLYSVLGTRTIAKVGTFAQTGIGFLSGSLVLLVVLLISGRPIVSGVLENIPIVLYVSVVVTGLGYIVYFLAIRYSNATTGSVTFLIKPAIAPIIAVIVLREEFAWNMAIGMACVLAASLIILLEKRKSDII
jgi:drug/metabolite transporter (DMT)-like permease